MKELFVIAADRVDAGPSDPIHILTRKGAWVRRDSTDVLWSRFPTREAAQRAMPECPPWARNVRIAKHAFMGV